MKKLLVVVDMQNDFIDGSLGTKEAAAIVPAVAQKIRSFRQNGDAIVFTKDTHFDNYLETQEGRNLPVLHCQKGTEGWEIRKELLDETEGLSCKIYEKLTFGSEELALDFKNGVYDDISEVEVIGLCTDICVISNAMLIKAMRPEIPLAVDASCCAGVTPASHQNALEAMKMCQIRVL